MEKSRAILEGKRTPNSDLRKVTSSLASHVHVVAFVVE
jgi:hypothetical protein